MVQVQVQVVQVRVRVQGRALHDPVQESAQEGQRHASGQSSWPGGAVLCGAVQQQKTLWTSRLGLQLAQRLAPAEQVHELEWLLVLEARP